MSGLWMDGTRLYMKDQADLQQMAAQTELTRENTNRLRREGDLDPLRRELMRAQVDTQRASAEHHGASSEHQRAEAEAARARASATLAKETREEKIAASIAKAMGGGKPAAPVFDDEGNLMPPVDEGAGGIASLADLGKLVMREGDLTKGQALLKTAADLELKGAQTKASLALAEERKLKQTEEKYNFMREVFSSVKSPADHARAVLLLQGNEMTAGEALPKALQTYDPKAISQFLAGSKVQLDKIRTDAVAFNAASADQARKAAQSTRDYLATLTRERTTAYVERQKNLEKVGGGDEKAVGMASAAELRMIRDSLAEEGIEFDGTGDEAAVSELAEQVKIKTTRNASLSRAEAIAQVVAEAKARGDLTPGEKRTILPNKKATYKQSEGTVSMPLPLPDAADGLVEGNYYRGSSGQVKQYKGGTFIAVSQRVPKPAKGK